MKKIVAVVALATLGGCAVYPPGPPNVIGRSGAASFDPYQWHTVAVEPAYAPRYSAAPTYYAQPAYSQPTYYQPMYAPQPYYAYPPVTIGLDFMFGGWYGSRHGGRGGHGYRGHGRR
jgi:hypothetical protein